MKAKNQAKGLQDLDVGFELHIICWLSADFHTPPQVLTGFPQIYGDKGAAQTLPMSVGAPLCFHLESETRLMWRWCRRVAGLGGTLGWWLSPQLFRAAEAVCAFRSWRREGNHWYLSAPVPPLKSLQCLNRVATTELTDISLKVEWRKLSATCRELRGPCK